VLAKASVVIPEWVAAMISRISFCPDAASGPVVLDHRLERLGVLPVRVLRRYRLHTVECELNLEVDRLLGPERTVVVEDRDAFGRWYMLRPALACHPPDEIDDDPFGAAVVPGRKRIQRLGMNCRSAG
jgi:hypothetical protein